MQKSVIKAANIGRQKAIYNDTLRCRPPQERYCSCKRNVHLEIAELKEYQNLHWKNFHFQMKQNKSSLFHNNSQH
jgi:hypothetical protein